MPKSEKLEFQTEVSQLLKLMINSVYSEKEVFVRELISNASDACDKLRYLATTKEKLIQDDPDLKIQIQINKKENFISFIDNGIGMNKKDLIENLGTIARSGTTQFIKEMSESKTKDLSLIGQFGVGFYSSYMVADKVEVITKKAGEKESWMWKSDGKNIDGRYSSPYDYRRYTGGWATSHQNLNIPNHIRDNNYLYFHPCGDTRRAILLLIPLKHGLHQLAQRLIKSGCP